MVSSSVVDPDPEPDPDPTFLQDSDPNNWFGSGAERIQIQIYVISLAFSCSKSSILSVITKILTLQLVQKRYSFPKVTFLYRLSFDFEKILCSAVQSESEFIRILSPPEPDPNGHENRDPDPNKVGSDPQDWYDEYLQMKDIRQNEPAMRRVQPTAVGPEA